MKKAFASLLILFAIIGLYGCSSPSEKEQTWRLGDYRGQYMGLKTEDDNQGGTTIFTKFEFTNYSSEPISFQQALNPILRQNGNELQRVDEEVDSSLIKVANNETLSMDIMFYTQDKQTPIEIIITNKSTGEQFSAKSYLQ